MSTINYRSASAPVSSGPSPSIWADCPVITIIKNPAVGIHLFEDFEGGTITDDVAQFRFSLVGDTPDITQVTDEVNGVVEIDAQGAINKEAHLVSNILYELAKNNRKKMWLEARFKLLDSNAAQAILFGLGEDSMLVADNIQDDGVLLGDYDFIGFAAMQASDGAVMGDIDAVYHEAGDGGTPTVVKADVVDIDGTTQDDTYWRLGLRFDGLETVRFYLNGISVGTLDLDDFDTSDQLTEKLGVVLGIKFDASVTGDGMQVDWIRFACEK